MGPEGHAVGYPLRGGELYNIIIDITHGTDVGDPLESESVWKSARSNHELVERFKDWCEPVRKLCAMTGEYLKWKLADFDSLDHWVHASGKVALLGDRYGPCSSHLFKPDMEDAVLTSCSCHPMMPYMAQGAAQATEDAATLRAALASSDSIPTALAAYEAQRKPRAAYVARNTRVLQEWLHLYDGSARDERDRKMQNDDSENPIFWAYSARKDWLFGHDALRLLSKDEREGWVPDLPPMPPADASVYKNKAAGGQLLREALQSRL